jgi:uncharacterized protein
MKTVNVIALALVIVGGLNWGLVGLFQFDLVAAIFGGQGAALARIVYVLVAIAAIYCFTLVRPLTDDRAVHARAATRH